VLKINELTKTQVTATTDCLYTHLVNLENHTCIRVKLLLNTAHTLYKKLNKKCGQVCDPVYVSQAVAVIFYPVSVVAQTIADVFTLCPWFSKSLPTCLHCILVGERHWRHVYTVFLLVEYKICNAPILVKAPLCLHGIPDELSTVVALCLLYVFDNPCSCLKVYLCTSAPVDQNSNQYVYTRLLLI
jgi:hypothetical protein